MPIDLISPEILKSKVTEPIKLVGEQNIANLNIAITCTGGGYISQLYAIR